MMTDRELWDLIKRLRKEGTHVAPGLSWITERWYLARTLHTTLTMAGSLEKLVEPYIIRWCVEHLGYFITIHRKRIIVPDNKLINYVSILGEPENEWPDTAAGWVVQVAKSAGLEVNNERET